MSEELWRVEILPSNADLEIVQEHPDWLTRGA